MSTAPGLLSPTSGVGEGDAQGTPLDLFRMLDNEFHFTGDMFANDQNALCENYRTIEQPYTEADPIGTWFANPPYSRGSIGPAMQQVTRASLAGNTVVTLTRLEPGARWFEVIHDGASELRLLPWRLKFRGQAHSYNFPCCVAVFRPYVRAASVPHIYLWPAAL